MTQPQTSKHLRVLREVGLVQVREAGKQRLYGLDARGLRPVHEWTGGFERFWSGSFDRLDAYLQRPTQHHASTDEGDTDGTDYAEWIQRREIAAPDRIVLLRTSNTPATRTRSIRWPRTSRGSGADAPPVGHCV